MTDYRPSSIAASLCKKLNAIPISEADRLNTDGVYVIVVADGRKLRFTRDDITRTLTEPNPSAPKTAAVDALEEAAQATAQNAKPRGRKQKGKNE
jgi:hypothetical protein